MFRLLSLILSNKTVKWFPHRTCLHSYVRQGKRARTKPSVGLCNHSHAIADITQTISRGDEPTGRAGLTSTQSEQANIKGSTR